LLYAGIFFLQLDKDDVIIILAGLEFELVKSFSAYFVLAIDAFKEK
jgi:hypothetical protein